MKVLKDFYDIKLNNTIVTLGKFDGSHIGHRLLFDTAASLKQEGMKAVIFTFDVNPGRVIRDNGLRTIQTNEERETAVYPEGIDYVIEFPFNKETMSMEPEDFVKSILVDRLGVRVIVVGVDFCFGRNRSGNVDTLKELGEKYGFTVQALEKVMYRPADMEEEAEVSSTLIKEEILKGHMEDVTAMLGKPYCVSGEIIHGKHLGSTIGIPTINQKVPDNKILPPDGVYATKTRVSGGEYMSVTNVGCRPTFDDGEYRSVETFILDFNQDVYGQKADVDFYKFLRPEVKFSGIDELKAEIQRNAEETRQLFKNNDR